METRHIPPNPSPDPANGAESGRQGFGCGGVGCLSPRSTRGRSFVLCIGHIHSAGFSAGFLAGITRGWRMYRARIGMEGLAGQISGTERCLAKT